MSIVNDLIELNGDKSDIQDALVAKGVASAGKHGFGKFAADITSITNQYSLSDEGKVVSGGALIAQTSTTATTNGTIDTTTNNEVVVNVSNSYTQADEGKVVSNGALVTQTAYPTTITENGTYDTTTNNSVTVEISGGSVQTGSLNSITVRNSSFTNSQTCTTFLFNGDSDLIYFHIAFRSSVSSLTPSGGTKSEYVDIIIDDYTPPEGSVWSSFYTLATWDASTGTQNPTPVASITVNNKFCITFNVGISKNRTWNIVGGFQRTS